MDEDFRLLMNYYGMSLYFQLPAEVREYMATHPEETLKVVEETLRTYVRSKLRTSNGSAKKS